MFVIEVKCASRYGSWKCAHFGTPEGASMACGNLTANCAALSALSNFTHTFV